MDKVTMAAPHNSTWNMDSLGAGWPVVKEGLPAGLATEVIR